MALKQRIADDLKAALLGGDRFVTETLRGLKAAILNEEVAQNKRDEGLTDDAIERIVAKEVKKRNESAAMYIDGGRPELADNELREAGVLNVYLPVQLDEAALKGVINESITTLGVSGPAAMGQVIGEVKKRVGTTADGATIAKLVKEALN